MFVLLKSSDLALLGPRILFVADTTTTFDSDIDKDKTIHSFLLHNVEQTL